MSSKEKKYIRGKRRLHSKKKLLIMGSIFILMVVLAFVLLFVPTITININGKKVVSVNVGDSYVDDGAESYLTSFFKKSPLKVETYSDVNTEVVGKYTVIYKAEYKWIKKETIRIVKVLDIEKPQINLKSQPKICKINNLVNLNVEAKDNLDGDISNKIKYRIDNDKIYISVSDSSNNKTEIAEALVYIDDEKPVINLNGKSNVYLMPGEKYDDEGAIATDSCDGDLTNKINIEGTVDVNTIGTYEIKYKVRDSAGNEVVKIRKVIVTDQKNTATPTVTEGYIYLTFDDGPCVYTKQILDILDKYNVKATFFVTNQFPNYQNMIKEEFIRGHTIGVHTYTHKWSIYSSIDDYLNDFNKMQDIIIAQTGKMTKYFRFPGGSSNTISRNYSKGIMTKLSNLMEEKGYVYFDWTFDSGDTSRQDNSKEAIIRNVKNHLKGDGEYVVLMHDIKKNNIQALPKIIEYGISNGYEFRAINDETNVVHLKIAN